MKKHKYMYLYIIFNNLLLILLCPSLGLRVILQ